MLNEFSNNLVVKRAILKPFKVEGKKIHPVIDISCYNMDLTILNVSPFAIIVEDGENKYILQLTHEEIDNEELFELFYSFID